MYHVCIIIPYFKVLVSTSSKEVAEEMLDSLERNNELYVFDIIEF